MDRMETTVLRAAAADLKRVFDEHSLWHENLLRVVFCDYPVDGTDLLPYAHRECTFGRWFYEQAPNGLRGNDGFGAMGREHQRLHVVATRLLRAARTDNGIDRRDFEELVATNARFRLDVDALALSMQAALGHRDALTGAYGRVEMLPALQDLQEKSRQGGRPCTLVFMDIDNLKRVNDTHGHHVGDAMLSGAIRYLDMHLRPPDKVFRYGGDEFLITLPGADIPSALSVVSRVREGLASTLRLAGPAGNPVRVTASFGLALLDPHDNVSESIGRADQALLLAKGAGRNRAIAWDESVTTGTHWRMLDVGTDSP